MKPEALRWLLDQSNPSVRMLTLIDVMGRPPNDGEVRISRESTVSYRPVTTLKKAQGRSGYWPPDDSSYDPKFTASVWQLMLLAEMGTPRTPWIESAIERFFTQHQVGSGAFCCPTLPYGGRVEEEPCLTGNMLRTLLEFGYLEDRRVKKALNWLPESQLEDGGWNCDYPVSNPKHSSFMSTIEPLWAYAEVPRPQWTKRLKRSAERGAEFLLAHRLYKSHSTWGTVELRGMNKVYPGDIVTNFHFPMYYYYDALHALRVLTRLGYQADERIEDAIHLMMSKKTPEGKWLLDGDWVRERTDKTRKTLVTVEQLHEPSKWVTLNCYWVLAKTGDLELPG